jgi:hypothetical protein
MLVWETGRNGCELGAVSPGVAEFLLVNDGRQFSCLVAVWWRLSHHGLFNGLIWPKAGCASIA